MIVYQMNRDGYFVGSTQADESPLEPGVFLIPDGCVEQEPPTIDEGERARWGGAEWIVEPIPSESEPEPLTIDQARDHAWMRIESGYRQALRSFAHADTTWDASDDSAMVLRDLLNRLANGQGLPRGKSVVTLRDTTGTTHDMDSEAIINLGAAGSDHRDECLEIRLSLIDEVRNAETVEALGAIDWPT